MSLGTSARKIVRRRADEAQAEAKRVRAETWDGAFWLLPQWTSIPIVERLALVYEITRFGRRDAFILTFCRQYGGPSWSLKEERIKSWVKKLKELGFEYLLTVIDQDLLQQFGERDPETYAELGRLAKEHLETHAI